MRKQRIAIHCSCFVTIFIGGIAVTGVPLHSQRDPHASAPDTTIFNRVVLNDCTGPSDDELAAVKQAVESFHGAGDLKDEAHALTLLGTLYENTGRFTIAIPYLQRSLELQRKLLDRKTEAHVNVVLADAFNHSGQYDVALKYVNDAV